MSLGKYILSIKKIKREKRGFLLNKENLSFLRGEKDFKILYEDVR